MKNNSCSIYVREVTENSNKQLMQIYPANFKLWVLLRVLWFLSFTSPQIISLGDFLCVWRPNRKLTKRSHSSSFIIKTPASIPARLIPHWIHFMCKEIFQPGFTGAVGAGWGGVEYIYIYIEREREREREKIKKNMFSFSNQYSIMLIQGSLYKDIGLPPLIYFHD